MKPQACYDQKKRKLEVDFGEDMWRGSQALTLISDSYITVLTDEPTPSAVEDIGEEMLGEIPL